MQQQLSFRERNARRREGDAAQATASSGNFEIPYATAVVSSYEDDVNDNSPLSPKASKNAKNGKSMGGAGNLQSSSFSSFRDLKSAPSFSGLSVQEEAPHESAKLAKDWPAGLLTDVIKSFNRPPNESGAKTLLTQHSWPGGLQDLLIKSCKKIPIRFFIVDDSGSMSTNDGNKILYTGKGKAKMVGCTRWSELCDSLNFHIDLAESASAPTEFRLLNGADPVLVGLGDDNGEGRLFAKEILQEAPAGQTPLCSHIGCVVRAIQAMATKLRANGQRAAVIIMTDGESTDGDLASALRPLEKLPVWMVIRLATDAPAVVKYWDEIDKELELEMDVLDDLIQDATQVAKHNPWLRYCDELHRMREFGAASKEMDLIDESPLGAEQVCTILSSFFNVKLSHPEADFSHFIEGVKRASEKESQIFDPLLSSFASWINLAEMRRVYGGKHRSKSCAIS